MPIGFGELHKHSLEWHLDIAEVERAYAGDWLLKALFEQAELGARLVLRGSAALRYAYSPNYSPAEPPEFLLTQPQEPEALRQQLTAAVQSAGTGPGGVKYSLAGIERGSVKVEYTGPLGRRSAAQPRIILSLIPGTPRLAPTRVALVHPFGDFIPASVVALAREELVGERLAALGSGPRARDVYDLWFAFTRWGNDMDLAAAVTLAREIAAGKGLPLKTGAAVFDPAHRVVLQRTWDSALRTFPRHPSLEEVEQDLAKMIETLGQVHG